MKKNFEMRIGIIGAGAAGLTAAETLREKGYKNITLFERESHAGGKCRSIQHKGRSYELGAGVVAENYQTVRNLAKKYRIRMTQVDFNRDLILDAKTGKPVDPKTSLAEKISLFSQLLRYRKLCRHYKNNEGPGLGGLDLDLCEPFSVMAKRHRIPLIAKELALYFTGYGYGSFDETPSAYVLKHYSWETVKSFIRRSIYKFPNGIQQLWDTIAKTFPILYNSTITTVKRGKTVIVKTEDGQHTFDALIVTSPLDESLHYLDATTIEKKLFSKIDYYDYRTYACILKNFPKKGGYLPGNFKSSKKGHPLFWYLRYADSDLYTFNVMGNWKTPDKEALENIEKIVHRLGGTMEKCRSAVRWKYFPHVSPGNMKKGYFDRLEKLQGEKHTYYAGELLNFSTVEHSAAYSRQLIEKYF